MRRFVIAVALVAACGPSGDPLNIHYTFSAGPEQTCLDQAGDPVRDCNDVAMTCDSVALLRIVDPEDANHVYLEQCGSIPNTRNPHNLCPITQAITPNGTFPTTRVEIQLAVYPRSELPEDMQHNPICPSHVEFTASQVAAPTNDPQPALAGVAYSDGYDSEITIELGCNDTGLIDTEECRDQSALDISASVLDFDQQFSVPASLDLAVRVGAPTLEDTHWTFKNDSTFEIQIASTTPEPTWAADNLEIPNLTDYLCLQVLEVVGRATPSITCLPVTAPVPSSFDLIGMRVEAATLDAVLDALGETDFPNGLVIGMVVNGGDPVAGATVSSADAGSDIRYLSADRMSFGGTSTSASGIFVSTNAPLEFGGAPNHWTASADMQTQRNDPIGGLIDDRLMVVVIQLDNAF